VQIESRSSSVADYTTWMSAMECNPGAFERIASTKSFDVKPAVLAKHDLRPVRYAYSEVHLYHYIANFDYIVLALRRPYKAAEAMRERRDRRAFETAKKAEAKHDDMTQRQNDWDRTKAREAEKLLEAASGWGSCIENYTSLYTESVLNFVPTKW